MRTYYLSDDAYEWFTVGAQGGNGEPKMARSEWIEENYLEWTTKWELSIVDVALIELVEARKAAGTYKGTFDPVVWQAAIGNWQRVPRALILSETCAVVLAEWAEEQKIWRKQRVAYTAMMAGYALEMFGRGWIRDKQPH